MKKFRVNDEVYCDAFGDGVVGAVLVTGGVRIWFGGTLVTFLPDGRIDCSAYTGHAPIPIFFRHSGRKDNLERAVELVVGETYRVRDGEGLAWVYRFYVGELSGCHWFTAAAGSSTLQKYKYIKEVPCG